MHVFQNKQNEPESCGAAQQLHPQVVDPYEKHFSEILRAFFIQGPYNFFMNRAAHIAKPRQIWATRGAFRWGRNRAPSDIKWTVQIATSLGHVVYKTSPPFPRRRLAETLDTARAVRRRAAPLRSAPLVFSGSLPPGSR